MLKSLYKTRAVVVWVEDELTKEYLRTLWQKDPRIGFAVAAGREGVSSLTNDARSAPDQRTNVFGVRDRDFGETNFPDWTNADTFLFRLPAYEIENYLLDWDALAGCAGEELRRNAAEIERRVKKRAAALTWWAACKRALNQIHTELTSGFPADPTQEEMSCLTGALNYVLKTNNWHCRACGLANGPLDKSAISDSLTRYHSDNELALDNASWLTSFPGKRLYREARSYVRGASDDGTAVAADIDLAKAIANWQVDNKRPPSDLVTLRKCLLQRAGLAHTR
ncbi:MAG TPA: DUF4435 domain-containing protein [bacterium]|nr:DUF4435 domain-containing protein [bacterium]